MKRSNRLILLIGLFLAVVAFVGVFMILQGNKQDQGQPTRTTTPTVFATQDIPLGTTITDAMLRQDNAFANDQRAPDAYNSTTLVVGKIARQDIANGAQITSSMFGSGGSAVNITVPPTKRAMSVQVDQVSGVGTLIKPGDYVDAVVGFTGTNFPVVTIDPTTKQPTPVTGVNGTSVKLLVQGMQVLGTLLPTPTTESTGNTASPAPGTTLNGQQEIVILDVTAQQSEVLRFAQMDGTITLVLRSSKDFYDPKNPSTPIIPVDDKTTGIILKTLVDQYGVLPPQVVETRLPGQ